MNLPPDAERWNKALLGSFKKGVVAQQAGKPINACPYVDTRTPSGRLSWSRAFITAWRDGWKWSSDGRA